MRFGFAIFLLSAALAQNPPDAAQILRKVSEKYTAANQFEVRIAVRITTRAPDGAPAREKAVSVHAAFAEPNRYLSELSGDTNSGSNGVHAWVYSPSRNEYWTGAPDSTGQGLQEAKRTIDPFRYTRSMTAKLLREEKIGQANCYVIEVHDVFTPPEGELTWVDKNRLVILRQQSSETSGGITETSTADYTTVKIDEPLPGSLFTFTPPPGAKQVDTLKQR